MIVRLYKVPEGSNIRILGLRYRVIVTDHSIILRRINNNRKISGEELSDLSYGLNCQMWVEILDTKPKPIKANKDHYTNISGHLKTIEKYSK